MTQKADLGQFRAVNLTQGVWFCKKCLPGLITAPLRTAVTSHIARMLFPPLAPISRMAVLPLLLFQTAGFGIGRVLSLPRLPIPAAPFGLTARMAACDLAALVVTVTAWMGLEPTMTNAAFLPGSPHGFHLPIKAIPALSCGRPKHKTNPYNFKLNFKTKKTQKQKRKNSVRLSGSLYPVLGVTEQCSAIWAQSFFQLKFRVLASRCFLEFL
jgi:hypothetical protein